MKRSLIYIFTGLAFVAWLVTGLIQPTGTQIKTGTVHAIIVNGQKFWGVQLNFSWLRPFMTRSLRVPGLPLQLQTDGKKVQIQYTVEDVTGTSQWDTVVDLQKIEEIQ